MARCGTARERAPLSCSAAGVRGRSPSTASGAPVLRDRGPDRPGTASPMQAWTRATPCSQSQIGQDRYLGSWAAAQFTAVVVLSVVVRSGPLRTVVNGTLMARQARMTPGTPVAPLAPPWP
jgi:hypothetical protein